MRRWALDSEFLWLVMIPRLKRTRQVRTNRSSVSNWVWHRIPRAISHLDILCSLKSSSIFGIDIVTNWGIDSSSPPFLDLWKPRITGRKTVFPLKEFLHFLDIKCGIKGVRKVLWTVRLTPTVPGRVKESFWILAACFRLYTLITFSNWFPLALTLLVVERLSDGQRTFGQSSMVLYGIQLPHKRRIGTAKSADTACWCLVDLQPTTWSPCKPRFLEWCRCNWRYYFVEWNSLLMSISVPATVSIVDQPWRTSHIGFISSFIHRIVENSCMVVKADKLPIHFSTSVPESFGNESPLELQMMKTPMRTTLVLIGATHATADLGVITFCTHPTVIYQRITIVEVSWIY